MPNFAFRPIVRVKGSASRKVGDALLLSGDRGVIVQVKRRAKSSDQPKREVGWLKNATASALR
jgi:hypothetical protein